MVDRLKLYSELQKTLRPYRNKKNKSYKNVYLKKNTVGKTFVFFKHCAKCTILIDGFTQKIINHYS